MSLDESAFMATVTEYSFTALDLADLNLPKTCQMDFPDPDDLLNFRLVIMPDEVNIYSLA